MSPTRLLSLSLLGAALCLAADPPQQPQQPSPLTALEQVRVLKLQRAIAETSVLIHLAKSTFLENQQKLAQLDEALQAFAKKLQQSHAAVGYNLDEDLNWIPQQLQQLQQQQQLGLEENANASDQPGILGPTSP